MISRFLKRHPKDKYTCPCCGYRTLTGKSPGSHQICDICFWEDDPVQFENPDFEVGANKASLKRAQKNFLLFGAAEREHIKNSRKPSGRDMKDPAFAPLEENNLRKIQIKEWIVVADIESTRRANARLYSGAKGCGCDDCKFFAANRGRVLPEEFKDLLDMFGVDYGKDIEVTCVDLAPNEKLYGGWYHANGEVIAGGDEKFVPLVADFEILISNKDHLAGKDFPRPVFQIEFSAKVRL